MHSLAWTCFVEVLLTFEMTLAGDTKVLHPEVDSKVLRWESPRGYDDQCDSDACANVVPIQQDILLLISSFKR